MTTDPLGAPGTPAGRVSTARSNISGPARLATVLLLGCCVTSLANGLAGLRRASVVGDVRAGTPTSDAALDAADTTVQMAVVVDVLLTGATSVVFVVWFWRLIKNAQLIERVTTPRSGAPFAKRSAPAAGWAIASWFVPIANLVLPAYFLTRTDRISGPEDRAQGLIVTWAVAFAFSNTVLRVLWRDEPVDLAELQSRDGNAIWWASAAVVAAVLAVLMVRRLTERQLRTLGLVRA